MPRQEQGIEYYFTPRGEKRYRVRWREGAHHRSRSFGKLTGPHGARAFRDKVRGALQAGSPVLAASAQGISLAEFAAEVWAPRAKRRLMSSTWNRDTSVYNKHILHHLGARPISLIDAEVLAEWQDRLEEAGVGAPTLIKAINILSSIFREAARRPRLTGVKVNPVALLEKPSAKRRRRPRVWGPVVVERVRFELLVHSKRIGAQRHTTAMRDALLVSLTEMAGARPGEALALRWRDIDGTIEIARALSGKQIVDRTKTDSGRVAPLAPALAADLAALREQGDDGPDDFVFQTSARPHWVQTDWRNYRVRHFAAALWRVEEDWQRWRQGLPDPSAVRESVIGLAKTRPYDLGRHTHSSLMLASGMSLQRLARIQGHSIRVLDEIYSEELAEFAERDEPIDPEVEIARARDLVWGERDPSVGLP